MSESFVKPTSSFGYVALFTHLPTPLSPSSQHLHFICNNITFISFTTFPLFLCVLFANDFHLITYVFICFHLCNILPLFASSCHFWIPIYWYSMCTCNYLRLNYLVFTNVGAWHHLLLNVSGWLLLLLLFVFINASGWHDPKWCCLVWVDDIKLMLKFVIGLHFAYIIEFFFIEIKPIL